MPGIETFAPHLAGLVFMGAMAHVVFTDLTTQRIHNWLIVMLVSAYFPLAFVAGVPNATVVASFGVAILVFMAAFGCFAQGWMGGGDVKLAAASALWLGPNMTLTYLLWTAVLGSLVTLSILVARRMQAQRGTATLPNDRMLPYGPGMALAAVILFPQSHWGAL